MGKQVRLSRRSFMGCGIAAAAPLIIPSSVFGATAPGSRIAIGMIGVGGMGTTNLKGFLGCPDAQVVAVCDVDLERARNAGQLVERRYGSERASGTYKGCAVYQDLRELIAREDIDAVCVSTSDHWHVTASMLAVASGKDVYCEKPLSLTIEEGRLLSDAVARQGAVFLLGSQQRSEWRFRYACELVRNGRIGQVKSVEVGLSKGRSHAPVMPQEPPDSLDWDLYVGPAAPRAYHQDCCHYNFRFISDFSGGQMLNWGAHHLDIAQWGLGTDRSGPIEVSGKGVFPGDGPYDNPVTYSVDYRYANGVVLNASTSNRTGTKWIGAEGWIYVNRGKLAAGPETLLDRSLASNRIRPDEIHLVESRSHKAHFLECIRTRRETVAPCEVGHRSASMGHMGNIAMRLEKPLTWDPETERFGDEDANRYVGRAMRAPWHLI